MRGYFHRRDSGNAFDTNVQNGLIKIVLVPMDMVPEIFDLLTEDMNKSRKLRIKNEYYARYQK